MAKVKLNPTIEAIQGAIGDLVYKRWDGEEIVARRPNRTGIMPTANQLAQMDKFRLAALYGKAALADPATRAIYQSASDRKGVPVFALTLGDFLNAPAIEEIDLSNYTGHTGELIQVRATDDMEVRGVTVAIREQGGNVIEEGIATWVAATATWNYTTTTNLAQGQAVLIEVSATDRPGHKSTRSQARS